VRCVVTPDHFHVLERDAPAVPHRVPGRYDPSGPERNRNPVVVWEASGRAVLLDVGAGPKGADGLSQAVFRNRGRPVRLAEGSALVALQAPVLESRKLSRIS